MAFSFHYKQLENILTQLLTKEIVPYTLTNNC